MVFTEFFKIIKEYFDIMICTVYIGTKLYVTSSYKLQVSSDLHCTLLKYLRAKVAK